MAESEFDGLVIEDVDADPRGGVDDLLRRMDALLAECAGGDPHV